MTHLQYNPIFHKKQAPYPIKRNPPYSPLALGIKKIVDSHEVYNRSARAMHFLHGGCDIVAKGYIPSTYNLTSNGPDRLRINPSGYSGYSAGNFDSEGMDLLNYVFNRSNASGLY